MTQSRFPRRQFIGGAAALGAGALVAPYARVLGANERVNVACIGTGGKGTGAFNHLSSLSNVNVVAVSDADRLHMDKAVKRAKGPVKKYQDFRKLLDRRSRYAYVFRLASRKNNSVNFSQILPWKTINKNNYSVTKPIPKPNPIANNFFHEIRC